MDGALIRIVEPLDEANDGGFSSTGGTHERHHLSGVHHKRYALHRGMDSDINRPICQTKELKISEII